MKRAAAVEIIATTGLGGATSEDEWRGEDEEEELGDWGEIRWSDGGSAIW